MVPNRTVFSGWSLTIHRSFTNYPRFPSAGSKKEKCRKGEPTSCRAAGERGSQEGLFFGSVRDLFVEVPVACADPRRHLQSAYRRMQFAKRVFHREAAYRNVI